MIFYYFLYARIQRRDKKPLLTEEIFKLCKYAEYPVKDFNVVVIVVMSDVTV